MHLKRTDQSLSFLHVLQISQFQLSSLTDYIDFLLFQLRKPASENFIFLKTEKNLVSLLESGDSCSYDRVRWKVDSSAAISDMFMCLLINPSVLTLRWLDVVVMEDRRTEEHKTQPESRLYQPVARQGNPCWTIL